MFGQKLPQLNETDVIIAGCHPTLTVIDPFCPAVSPVWDKDPPTCWKAEQHTPRQQVSPSDAMSPQATADASPTSDPQNTFVTVGRPLCLLFPLSSPPAAPDLPSATLGVTLSANTNSPTVRCEMPPLWKMLCKWFRAAFSDFSARAWALHVLSCVLV